MLGTVPGVVVATSAVAAGVISEAVYAGWAVSLCLRTSSNWYPPVRETITLRSFLNFYIPLAMTSLLTLLVQPIGSAALSRACLKPYPRWPSGRL